RRHHAGDQRLPAQAWGAGGEFQFGAAAPAVLCLHRPAHAGRGAEWLARLGKRGGSAVAARLTGFSWPEALQLGALMNTRGLMELIALNIGYDLGILSPRIFTMLVIMALTTTILTGPLLKL